MLSISMPNILVFIDDAMARALEKVAPARSRERSRFIRLAIQKALMELEDVETMKAYERIPQDAPDAFTRGEWDKYMPADVRKIARASRKSSSAKKPSGRANAKRTQTRTKR